MMDAVTRYTLSCRGSHYRGQGVKKAGDALHK